MRLLEFIYHDASKPDGNKLVEKDKLRMGMTSYDVDIDNSDGRIQMQVLQNTMDVAELVYEDGEIIWIHVEPFFRKQGLGSAMVAFLQDKGYPVVMPDARTDAGKAFFKKLNQKGQLDESNNAFSDEGFYIDDRGRIHMTDHSSGYHHADLAADHFGEHMDDLYDEDGELDEYGQETVMDAALDAGWIRVTTIDSPNLMFEFQGQPPLVTMGALIAWIVSVPDQYTISFGTTSDYHTGTKGEILTLLQKDIGTRYFNKAAEVGLGESISEALSSVRTYTPEMIAQKHGVSVEQITQQLRLGIEVEREHTTDPQEARTIALDHLLELPDYYDRLADMEGSGELHEAFDSPLSFQTVSHDTYASIYQFTSNGVGFTVSIEYDDDYIWTVMFSKSTGELIFAPTGKSTPREAMSIYSTVIATILDFIKRRDHGVHGLKFDGSKSSRLSKVYDAIIPAMAKRHGFSYDVDTDDHDHTYMLDVTGMMDDGPLDLGEATKPWLRITPEMERQARGNKNQLVAEIPAEQFLMMTTSSDAGRDQIKQLAHPIASYNRWAKAGDDRDFQDRLNVGKTSDDADYTWGSIHMPWLTIQMSDDGTTGQVVGHEGRHRAASSLKVGNTMITIAIGMRPGKNQFPNQTGMIYNMNTDHLPKQIVGQYDGVNYPTSDWKITNDNLQNRRRG